MRGISWAAAGLAVAVASATLPAAAQTAPPVDSPRALEILARYNEATQAAIMCENRPFGIEDEKRAAEVTARATGVQFMTGSMLTTVQNSRGWMRMMVSSLGCRDAVVMDRLAFFNQQIAPNLR
jgi:hypothetical protein